MSTSAEITDYDKQLPVPHQEAFKTEGQINKSTTLQRGDNQQKCSIESSVRDQFGTVDQIGTLCAGMLSPIPHSGDAKLAEAIGNISILSNKDSLLEDNGAENDVGNDQEKSTISRVNKSITSTESTREEEILQMQFELGVRSQAFIERLRGAAFRRKMNLARSRDSLMAKEKQQRETLAAAKLTNSTREEKLLASLPLTVVKQKEGETHFKARLVPTYVGIEGTGGLSGVPKVEKKPITTPFSPLLGARRLLGKNSLSSRRKETEQSIEHLFHARPLPVSSSTLGHGGQFGVPKVPKRPVTVPFSPLLGGRRKHNKPTSQDPPPKYRTSNASSQISNASPALLGLDCLSVASSSQENVPPKGYQPRSTVRAEMRANYEARRLLYEQEQRERIKSTRQEKIRTIEKELRELRKSL